MARVASDAYETLCDEIGAPPAQVALAWLLHNPAVTAAIVGPRTVEQLHQSLGTVDLTLSEAKQKRLDEIWPGPSGEAPIVCAW